MGIIAKPLSYLLIWLYDLVGSYGIAILILTVLIKLCLYPLYAKQIKSTMRMTDVQPKIKEIQQKYAKDTEIMILWFARTYPAGLALYWFGSQVIQIFYNLRFNKLKKAQQEAKQAKSKKKK